MAQRTIQEQKSEIEALRSQLQSRTHNASKFEELQFPRLAKLESQESSEDIVGEEHNAANMKNLSQVSRRKIFEKHNYSSA